MGSTETKNKTDTRAYSCFRIFLIVSLLVVRLHIIFIKGSKQPGNIEFTACF